MDRLCCLLFLFYNQDICRFLIRERYRWARKSYSTILLCYLLVVSVFPFLACMLPFFTPSGNLVREFRIIFFWGFLTVIQVTFYFFLSLSFFFKKSPRSGVFPLMALAFDSCNSVTEGVCEECRRTARQSLQMVVCSAIFESLSEYLIVYHAKLKNMN